MIIPVILLNYNSFNDCCKCVGLLMQQIGVDLEIIIVDNASEESEIEKLKLFCRENNITLLLSKENKGYNAGNNVGLRYAASKGYEYALIANPDMEFHEPHYIVRLVEELRTHSDAVAVGSDIITPEGIHQNPMQADGNWRSSFFWIQDLLYRNRPKDAYAFIDDYKSDHQCAKLSGCALMVNVNKIEKLGFFDEYPFLYCEEAIFAKQASRAGMTLRYVAEVQAIHRHIASAKGDPRPRFRHWLRSRRYFINKYSGYPWYGRIVANISWSIYLRLMMLYSTVRRK